MSAGNRLSFAPVLFSLRRFGDFNGVEANYFQLTAAIVALHQFTFDSVVGKRKLGIANGTCGHGAFLFQNGWTKDHKCNCVRLSDSIVVTVVLMCLCT